MSYIREHPTHWNLRGDVKAVAWEAIRKHGGSFNTYINHPPPLWLDDRSVDFWGYNPHGGDYDHRGYTLPYEQGERIFNFLWNAPGAPYIRWIIWQGWIWEYGKGWRWYHNFEHYSDAGHHRHIHVTYF